MATGERPQAIGHSRRKTGRQELAGPSSLRRVGVRDLTGLHRGHLVEQVVGQELKSTDARADVPLVFWVRDKAQSQAEVDFLLRTERGIVPVEVKSGAAGKLRSLHQFMGRSGARLAVRLCAAKPSRHSVEVGNLSYILVNIPYYAASMIPQYAATEG